ncbi:hypothetical protein OG394_23470 [Kribbella sp. NBC_01245]|uniref:TolB family protein n=1 Tax=Kribbella sp. NBC_01245 TaxID=2903578 RepID=UPI002E27BCA3|nr:hypothetical protein [Kribbella sp. NBC_01245]
MQSYSIGSAGNQADGGSGQTGISADGRFVTFDSNEPDFAPGDGDDLIDVFVHDLADATTSLVSVNDNGRKGNGDSLNAAISANGRFVVFDSQATNLVRHDQNGDSDVFVRDLQARTTKRVSVSSTGAEGNETSFNFNPSISADGQFVVFQSQADNLVAGDSNRNSDVFVHNNQTATTTLVSKGIGGPANSGSGLPYISGDGRFVGFISAASNLVPNDTNGSADVFVYDRVTGSTRRVNVDSAGNQAAPGPLANSAEPSLSGDGRFVAFGSLASNLVSGDTNGALDIFVHDQQTGTTTRVSVDSAGGQGNRASSLASISADGRLVSFDSRATNLVPGDTNRRRDVFVHDRLTGVTTRESGGDGTAQSNGDSGDAVIAPNGNRIAFESLATNLVAGDTNGLRDAFLHDLG